MAASSYTETTAISFRKGDHDANNAFTGIAGEIVVDLGKNGKGTDNNTSVVLHNGITQGGIPMARADMGNVTTRVLAENRPNTLGTSEKNLAYADLSNIEKATKSADKNKIVQTLSEYGLATSANINTNLENYAYKSMANVNTEMLATGENQPGKHQGKNLAYADTTNINTSDLADPNKHNEPVAYASGTNINTENLGNSTLHETPLAYADLSNVSPDDLINAINERALGNLEKIANKDDTINEQDIQEAHYPETGAVINYVNEKLSNVTQNALRTDFLNASQYDALYENNVGVSYKYNTSQTMLVLNSSNVDKWKCFSTGKKLTGLLCDLKFHVDKEDATLANTVVSVNQRFGTNNIANTEVTGWKGNMQIGATLKSTSIGNGIYEYTLTNFRIIHADPDFDLTEGDFIPFEQDIKIEPVLTICVTSVTGSNPRRGPINTFIYRPSKSPMRFNDETLTLVENSLKIKLNSIQITSNIGGGQLLKTNLSNLAGMDEDDALAVENVNWRIRPDELIMDPAEDDIDDTEFNSIAVNGQVWYALKKERAWVQTQLDAASDNVDDNFVTLNTAQNITATKTFSGIKVPDRADGDNTTNAANTKFVTKAINALSNSSLGMPDYSNPTELTESSGTASATGWIGLSTYNYAGGHFNFYINSSLICNIDRMDGDGSHEISCLLPVKAGDTWSRSGGNAWHVYFYPNRS